MIPAVGVLSILYVLVGLLAVAVDRPPTALAGLALVLLVGGVVGSIIAGWAQLVGYGHAHGLDGAGVLGRWSVPASVSLFAGAAVLLRRSLRWSPSMGDVDD